MMGMMMSLTSDVTMAPNATPMITPTARSTTFPRSANFLNSSSIPLIDQSGVDHRLAHRGLGLVPQPHHRQPHRLFALAEDAQRIFRGRRIGLEEQGGVQ